MDSGASTFTGSGGFGSGCGSAHAAIRKQELQMARDRFMVPSKHSGSPTETPSHFLDVSRLGTADKDPTQKLKPKEKLF